MVIRVVEPVPASARLRFGAREVVRAAVHEPRRAAYRARLRRLAVAPRGSTAVNFGWIGRGGDASPEASIGGGVKLGHLRERFGEAREAISVVYLVSSILHLVPCADLLVAWAKRHGVPVVWNQNGVAYPAWCGAFYPWFNLPMRRLIARADHVVYQSAFCRDSSERYLGPVGAESEVLWNPVDLGRFSPADAPPPMDRWRLLAAGTSHALYRTKAAVDCAAELARRGVPVDLVIAGEQRWPGADDDVRRAVREAGLDGRVTMLPRFSQDEAADIYRAAHVLIHPKYKDPCPTVPIEAMACGVPVVGSASGGMPELVPPDAGELVAVPDSWTRDHAPDARSMADAVERVMRGREAAGRAARAHAERAFGRDAWVERHEEIFRGLLAK